ncbi:AraC family transcriptional regulator [Pseudozobellia thermophila]|uniref:AraC-type DNA-binding protein n=1 Tax=Pseudozobellia thermophila TaxID=192903 RepID=A0A1M6GHG3_9FLAO|nr:AraC family transcriptional regulator [Pseudozobellia thermophila]SHJ09425.1 AraC-type DNA-binding protein [Pseudozobellia thermophila]
MKPQLEAVPFSDNSNILAYCYEDDHFDAPWHIHPQCELTYIASSKGTKFIGDHVSPYEPGELVLLNANLPHCWKNYTDTDVKSTSLVVQWNTGIFSPIPELQSVKNLIHSASHGLLFSREATKRVIKKVKMLPRLRGASQYLALLDVLNDLSTEDYTLLSTSKFIKELPWEHNDRMAKIHDFVAAHYQNRIQLKTVSDMVNLSEQAFSRFFKKMMGRSFFNYLNEYRINLAAKMLIDTDMAIADVAYASGFETLPFFFKKFKARYGTSPKTYRKKYCTS